MIEPQFLNTLSMIYDRLKNSGLNWVVTGSLGMALQGVDVEVHDIDIQTNKKGAYEIEDIFSEYVTKPVDFRASERIHSHFGGLEIEGVKIDIMGDVQKFVENEGWEEPVKVEQHKQWVNVDQMRIPVLSIEYEYEAYLKLGRIKKAEKLRRWLEDQRAKR